MSKQLHEYKTTAAEARAVGDKFYFPNKECFRGHVGLRYLSSGCRECHLLRSRGEKLPPLKLVYGVGYNSAIRKGIPVFEGGKISKCYDAWRRMLQRCYDPQYKLDHPTYVGVTCCEDWKDYQNFAKWFYEQPNHDRGYELDKDLLVEGNKLYSPSTCTLLPMKINKAVNTKGYVSRWREKDGKFTFSAYGKIVGYDSHYLTNAEDIVNIKNSHISSLREEYKDFLTDVAYQALKEFRFMYSLDGKIYRGFY